MTMMLISNDKGISRTNVLVIGAFLGLITAILLYIFIFGPDRKKPQLSKTIIATVDISMDTYITQNMVKIADIPQSDLIEDAVTNLEDVVNKVSTSFIPRGSQISRKQLTDRLSAYGLAGIIPPGTRAMTISVDSSDFVSGFLQPGDRIDVVASFFEDSQSIAKTILQNVPLLAVDSNIRPIPYTPPKPEEQGKPVSAGGNQTTTQITIAVTPIEAEALAAAQFKGKLKIGLRGRGDPSRYKTPGINLNKMLGLISKKETEATDSRPVSTKSSSISKTSFVKKPQMTATVPPVIPDIGQIQPLTKTIRVIKGSEVNDVTVAN